MTSGVYRNTHVRTVLYIVGYEDDSACNTCRRLRDANACTRKPSHAFLALATMLLLPGVPGVPSTADRLHHKCYEHECYLMCNEQSLVRDRGKANVLSSQNNEQSGQQSDRGPPRCERALRVSLYPVCWVAEGPLGSGPEGPAGPTRKVPSPGRTHSLLVLRGRLQRLAAHLPTSRQSSRRWTDRRGSFGTGAQRTTSDREW